MSQKKRSGPPASPQAVLGLLKKNGFHPIGSAKGLTTGEGISVVRSQRADVLCAVDFMSPLWKSNIDAANTRMMDIQQVLSKAGLTVEQANKQVIVAA